MARCSVQRVHRRRVARPCRATAQNLPRGCGRSNRARGGPGVMEANDKVRHYAEKNIEISYDPRRCIHAAECVSGLPAVFDSTRRPWIMPAAASADEIARVIAKC